MKKEIDSKKTVVTKTNIFCVFVSQAKTNLSGK